MAETFDPAWMVLFIIRIVIVIATVFFMSFLILSVVITLEDDELNRFAHEMGEVMLNSEIVHSKGVFSESALDRMIENSGNEINSFYPSLTDDGRLKMFGDGIYPNIEPRLFRHCSFGYNVRIDSLISGKQWRFGYRGDTGDNSRSSTENIPVSILMKDGSIEQAELHIFAFLSPLTRYSCLAEKAKEYGTKQSIGLPLCDGTCVISLKNFDDGIGHICNFEVARSASDTLATDLSCRYLPGVKIIPSYFTYDGTRKINLAAYPLKSGAQVEDILSACTGESPNSISLRNCNSLAGKIAENAQETEAIVFCTENG